MNSLWCSISGAMPKSRQSVAMVRTQWGQMATIFCTFCGREGLQAGFGQVLEDEVVAQAAGGVAGAFFLPQHAEGGAEVVHDAGEVGDDLAAVGVVAAHAAEPEAVLLGAVEDGEGGAWR